MSSELGETRAIDLLAHSIFLLRHCALDDDRCHHMTAVKQATCSKASVRRHQTSTCRRRPDEMGGQIGEATVFG